MSASPQMQLEADWDEFCRLETEIVGAESTGLRARWEFGHRLLGYKSRRGRGGSPLADAIRALCGEFGCSEQELYFRRQFAHEYPDEHEFSNALENYRSWYAVIERGLGERGQVALGGLKESVHVDWYTPAPYIEAARDVLGGIDLDPASSPMANETVGASRYYTEDDNGLIREWLGRVWLNPPYGSGSGLFTTKLVEEYQATRTTAAILLLNAYGFDSHWFQPLWDHPICFTNHRVQFTSPARETGGPANANLFVYLGPDKDRFLSTFSQFGAIVERVA